MSTTPLPNAESQAAADSSEAELLRLRAEERYATLIKMKKQFYFLTIPGALRLLEIFLSVIHIGTFGYYGTFYDKIVEGAMSPLFLGATREAFFLMANYNTFLTTLTIVMASLISARSHSALVGSIYLFIFDFLQFLLIAAASVGLILLYLEEGAKDAYADSQTTRQGLSITGLLLALLHLIGAIYDLGIYVRRTDSDAVAP